MPYYPKRRYAPKRKTSVKSRFRKPAAPMTMGKFKQEVKRMIYKTKEKKMHGSSLTENTNVNTWDMVPDTWNNFLNIPQGDAFDNRDGNEVQLSGMKFSGFIHSNGTNVGPIGVRMSVIQHLGKDETNDYIFTKPNGVDTSDLATGSECLHWTYNRECYKTLYNKVFIMNTDSAKDNCARMFRMWVKPLVRRLKYDSSSTDHPQRNVRFVVYARRLDNDESTGTTIELSLNHTAYFVDV